MGLTKQFLDTQPYNGIASILLSCCSFKSRGFKTTPETFWGKPRRIHLLLVSPKHKTIKIDILRASSKPNRLRFTGAAWRHCTIVYCAQEESGLWATHVFHALVFLKKPFCHILPIHEFAVTFDGRCRVKTPAPLHGHHALAGIPPSL